MSDEENNEPIADMEIPRNGLTGNPYKGANVPALQEVMIERDFKSPEFVTFKQAIEIGYPVGANVKSCGSIVRWVKPAKGSGAKRSAARKNKAAKLFPKTSAVWNIEQLDTENYGGEN